MSKLPPVTGDQVVAVLLRDGWVVDRVRGSHHVLKKAGQRFHVVVGCHRGETIPPGTLSNILRQAGMSRERLLALLRK
jgi:predicted RNA binding protein YcfA (HicA-like mRNA interferase family)